MKTAGDLVAPLRSIHARMRDAVVIESEAAEQCGEAQRLAAVAHDASGDTIFAIDRVSEARLIEEFEDQIARYVPVVLIAEGLPDGGRVVLPRGTSETEAKWRIIVDPIDGTRGLMYQKRSAWILTGVAPNRGAATSTQDIELASKDFGTKVS